MSSISIWEKFLGTDWERYGQVSSKITCLICAACGVLSILFGFSIAIGLWSILCALVLAIWEYPFIYSMLSQFDQIKETLMETFLFKLEEVRAVVCFGLSIFCFFDSLCVFSGLALIITAFLLGFAAVNRRVDAMDGLAGSGSGSSSSSNGSSSSSVPYQQRSAVDYNNAFVSGGEEAVARPYNGNSTTTSLLPR